MKEITLLKQACICCFATISLTFFSISKTNAQISTLDSLKQILISFRENIADSSLEHNLWETQMLMGEDSISDTLITRLLGLEDALYNAEALDAKTTARYFLLVTRCLQQLKDSMPLAEALNNQGLLYVSMGLYDKALPSYQQALAIITNSNKTMQDIYIDVLVNLANLYENLGLYEESLSLFSKVMSIEGDSTDEEHLQLHANTLSDMAYLYESMGQIEKALPLYQQALKLMEKNADKDYHIYAICVSNLAGVYETLKQEEKADTLYHLALKIMENAVGKNHHDYAMCLNDLAYLHRKDMNQYEKVESLFLQALAINKKRGEDHPDYATGLNNLASLYRSRANFFKNKRLDKEADSLYKKSELLNFQALSIYKNKYGTNHPAYANSLSQLAVMYTDMALYKKADTLYRQALKIRTQFFSENHAVYIGNVNNLGLVDIFLKDNTKGLDLLTKANELRLRNIAFTISTLSEEEKLRLIATESYKFDFLPSVLLTTKTESNKALNQLYNSQLLLKGMILQSQQNILRHLRNDSNKKAFQVYEQWKFNKRLIGKQLLLRANQRISYLDSLQNITSELEQSLSRISTDFNNLQKSQSITVNEIAKNLIKEHAASIEFMRFQLYNRKWTDSFVYAALMLLPGDSIVKFIPLCEERQLQHLLLFRGFEYIDMSSLSTYRASSNNQPKSANDSLYLVIWKPLEKYLSGITKIYYAPTGLLHRISFEALKTGSTYLLDKYQLNRLLSTRSIVFPEKISLKPILANIWGNIQYNFSDDFKTPKVNQTDTLVVNLSLADLKEMRGKEFESLPGTLDELRALQGMFQHADIAVSIDSGAAATEEKFKTLDGRSPQILHLATHGFFLPVDTSKNVSNAEPGQNTFSMQQDPMFRSGLALAGANYAWKGNPVLSDREDGILTAYEIAQMDLTHTDIAVLSACETGLGDIEGNEGVLGLQRALKLAGAKQIIMSLWRVPDKESRELMTDFYTNWLNGEAPAEALRSAQLKMKDKYPFVYWAAFVLVE